MVPSPLRNRTRSRCTVRVTEASLVRGAVEAEKVTSTRTWWLLAPTPLVFCVRGYMVIPVTSMPAGPPDREILSRKVRVGFPLESK